MALIRWTPVNDIFNLHSELDRVFGEMTQLMSPQQNGGAPTATLPLDIKRTEKALEITASLPGFQPDNVAITVDKDVLTIDAHAEQVTQQDDSTYVRRERYTGRLFRQVFLGVETDGEAAQASFQDGVLTVTVPLTQKPEPRKIPVSTTVQGTNSK